MKKLFLILLLLSSQAEAHCFCACSNGKSIPACTEPLELPTLICSNVC